jgi:predicted ATPase
MRLKSVHISQYKNLINFNLPFDGSSFIDVFVGKNGSGKSNLFEALIEIFRHLYEYGKGDSNIPFSYNIQFEIGDNEQKISTKFAWDRDTENLLINGEPFSGKVVDKKLLPDNVLIYYSGHNKSVSALIESYEHKFSGRIKKANFSESREFIGVGHDYKALLLSVLLLQVEDNMARKFICDKMGINTIGAELKLDLSRPAYAFNAAGKINKKFNVVDPKTDQYWKPEGITKFFLDRLSKCISTAKGGTVREEGYLGAKDRYVIYYDIGKIQQEFTDFNAQELFRQFDNLKTLGMLTEISIPLRLSGNIEANLSHFSDGQFQSVYIYSIIELFKDRNCITLLDEPDSFLHPEWQFKFLEQVFEITDTASKNNHVLMSSHSASTITTANDNVINLFEFNGSNVVVTKVKKADVIKSLSAGLIAFSESEARLNIHHVLNNTTGAVLFTEGITDEMILETAWSKLYPARQLNFEIQNAFSCGFLRNLVNDKELYRKYPGRMFFSIFDFDEAFKDWNQLGQDVQADPDKCLVKKHNTQESYSLLLPVPANPIIRKQVINPHTGGNYGDRSLLTIEHLFYGIDGLDSYYVVDTARTDGFIKFISNARKVPFAKDIVPALDESCFEGFKPIFEFIESKYQS